ncbi:Cupredoxin [Lophiotrema nucula]|uniref:Cupredoxin n=1 Tax=Lophiotrema nucula TaxID=690887 RepID=A0A6A5Z027_9PLEO|nr:Cupredoxin [Lophiotrema nucula]
MHFSKTFAAAALAGSALAADHTIRVGGDSGATVFIPNNVTAAEGDTVTFHFWPKNHSVAQASFAKPCEPLANGFWSGFVPTTDTTMAASLSYMINITNASQPIWFYCATGTHCNKGGMVGGINVKLNGTGNTLEAFAANATKASANVAPTETAGAKGMLMNGTMTGAGSTATTGAASTMEISNMAFTGLFGMIAYALL